MTAFEFGGFHYAKASLTHPAIGIKVHMGKKKKQISHPRQEYIYGTTKGQVSEIGITINPETGEIEFLGDMIDTYTQVSYERPKSDKVLARVPSRRKIHTFEADDLLFRDYAKVFAVDTASGAMDGVDFSVTSIVNVKNVFAVDAHGAAAKLEKAFSYGIPFCFFFKRPAGNPETLGWGLLIEELVASNLYRKSASIGIIVDSELSRLKDINARREPIRAGFPLPTNMTLIYAADAAADTAANHLIRTADKTCAMTIKEILNRGFPCNPRHVAGPPFRGQTKLTSPNSTVL